MKDWSNYVTRHVVLCFRSEYPNLRKPTNANSLEVIVNGQWIQCMSRGILCIPAIKLMTGHCNEQKISVVSW